MLLAGAGVFFAIGLTVLGIVQAVVSIVGIVWITTEGQEMQGSEPVDKATA